MTTTPTKTNNYKDNPNKNYDIKKKYKYINDKDQKKKKSKQFVILYSHFKWLIGHLSAIFFFFFSNFLLTNYWEVISLPIFFFLESFCGPIFVTH